MFQTNSLSQEQLKRATQAYALQQNHLDELYHTGQLHSPQSFYVHYKDEERSLLKQYDLLDNKTEQVLSEYQRIHDRKIYDKFINISNTRQHCGFSNKVDTDTHLAKGRYSNNKYIPSQQQVSQRSSGTSLQNPAITALFSENEVKLPIQNMFDQQTYAKTSF